MILTDSRLEIINYRKVKKVYVFICVFFFFIVVFKLYYNNTNVHWLMYSKTILESKEKGVFITEYEVFEVKYDNDKLPPDSLLLKELISWKEKEWEKPPYLIFFHLMKLTGKEILIIKNPVSLSKEFVFFKSYSDSHRANRGYSLIKFNGKIPDKLTLYFNYFNKISGRIKLRKIPKQ